MVWRAVAFFRNDSRGPQGDGLVIAAVAAVVVGLDVLDPEGLGIDAAPGVADGDDIEELLADVGRNDELRLFSLEG